MPKDQRTPYVEALWRCDELEQDIRQMVQDIGMSDDEVVLVLSRMLFNLTNKNLLDNHDRENKRKDS